MKVTLTLIVLHLALLSYLVLYNINAWADELTCPNGMTLINGGTYRMGDNHSGFVEEKVVEDVSVKDFCIDTYEVSNAQFAEFIAATGYKTVAERPLSLEQFPDLP
ncbi:MAG: formylglycine-generating enzyme family protein, partial [Leptolyngbyaceae cyanobacterium SM1_4_3]|nr:formylglycine-generating enzyme family protein [Leptolyngbyaceae cyanobacterium SM1_4_3]